MHAGVCNAAEKKGGIEATTAGALLLNVAVSFFHINTTRARVACDLTMITLHALTRTVRFPRSP